MVVNEMLKHQEVECKQCWENSSIKDIVEVASSSVTRGIHHTLSQDSLQVSSQEIYLISANGTGGTQCQF
jgi:hypothetical protein